MERGRISDTWERGDPYERYVGRWSRRVAPLFLAWLRVPPGRRWVDVGCGTGALTAAIFDHSAPFSVAGVEPSDGFLAGARAGLPAQALLHRGTATALPLEDDAVDAAVSGLVLNFVADPAVAVAEMARVARGGGTVAAYVWDYAGRMEMMRLFWDAAVELDPGAAGLDEGVRFPLCRPEVLAGLFAGAGLGGVGVTALDVATPFESFGDYWGPFLGGQGPGPAYAMSLGEDARARLRERVRGLLPVKADGSIDLTARAWAVRGTVAKS
jgi:SAM-dependent methyltransferase